MTQMIPINDLKNKRFQIGLKLQMIYCKQQFRANGFSPGIITCVFHLPVLEDILILVLCIVYWLSYLSYGDHEVGIEWVQHVVGQHEID